MQISGKAYVERSVLSFPELYSSPHLRKVRVRLIRLSHLVHVFLLLHGRALLGGSVEEFESKFLGHRNAFAVAGSIEDPSDRERQLALGSHFGRHLIDGSSDTLGANFAKMFS